MTITPSTAVPPEVTAKWPHGLTLAQGSHEDADENLCLLEAVAFFQGQPHTDRPPCVSPVLGAMGRKLNDGLATETRQLLVPLIPLLPGTAGDGHDEARGYLALDWLIRVHLPAWLDHVPGRQGDAAKLRELGEIADHAAAIRVRPLVREIRTSTYADAAAADAYAYAYDAAAAAADAAADAADAYAYAADAAAAAADAAAADAYAYAADAAAAAAADAAAADALRPTVEAMQLSAIDLFWRMTLIGRNGVSA